MLKQNGISATGGPHVLIYRYLPVNHDPAHVMLQKNKDNLQGVSLVNFTPDTMTPTRIKIEDIPND